MGKCFVKLSVVINALQVNEISLFVLEHHTHQRLVKERINETVGLDIFRGWGLHKSIGIIPVGPVY